MIITFCLFLSTNVDQFDIFLISSKVSKKQYFHFVNFVYIVKVRFIEIKKKKLLMFILVNCTYNLFLHVFTSLPRTYKYIFTSNF